MKVLIRRLEARLQRLSPLTITAIGLLYVLVVTAVDFACPPRMTFSLFYLLGVAFVGWSSGNHRAAVLISLASATLMAIQNLGTSPAVTHGWVAAWNVTMHLVVFIGTGWLTVELGRLTRNLGRMAEDRSVQWKAEAEQHKATAARLAEALERFEQVVNNITEVFWLTNLPKNQMIYISPGYERIWGRKCDELYRTPESWLSALHPADREAVKQRSLTEQAGGTYDAEYRIIRPDGSLRWIRDRAFPVRNAQGEVYRVAGIAEDITERKKNREVLQMQAAILENMAEGVVVTDEQGLIVQMNPAGERIWGYERNEVLGKPASVLSGLPEPEATAVMREVLAALRATGAWRGTFRNRRKDGRIIVCEAVISRMEVQGRVHMVAVEQDVTERIRLQEQLQMQARVLESMAEAALMVDESGTIVLTNPALDALVGYQAGELAGQPMHVLAGVSIEAHNRILEATLEQVRTGSSATGEYFARRKDGTTIEVETRSSGLTVGGRFLLVVVGQDITQRKQAEQALRQSEESLRVFLDAVLEPALLLDREGTILVANRAMGRRLRIAESELKGKYVFGLLPANVAEGRKAMFDQVVRSREPVRFEDEHAGRHFINSVSPVLDAVGNVSRVAVFAWDITERKQGERALAQKEELYRTLFELSPDGILLEDTDGHILDVNEAMCHSFGYSRAELLAQNVRRFVPPEGQGQVEAHLAALRTGTALQHEVWNLRKSGERCLMRLNEKPLALPDGRKGIMVVVRDITETKRAELAKEAFLSLGTKLSAARSPLEAAKAIYTTADSLWKWDCGALDVYLPSSGKVETVLACDVMDGQRREVVPPNRVRPPTARMLRIMERGAELILRKPGEVPQDDFVRIGDTSRLSASLMYVPVHREGRPLGVLSIQTYTPNAYTQEDLRTLQALADHCGEALERVHAEAVLRESEQTYRALVETTGTGYLILNMEGRVVDANAEYVRLSGHNTLEEILGRSVVEWTAPADRQGNAAAVEECVKTGAVRNLEVDYAGPNGLVIPVEVNGTVVQTRKGGAILSLCRDITERKRAQQTKEAFLSLGTKLSAATNPVEAARAVYATADQLWKWDSATLALYSPESGHMEPVLYCDLVDGQRRDVPADLPARAPTARMRQIMEQGAKLILRRECDMQDTESLRFGDVSRLSASIMCVPMRHDGQPVGIFSIQSYTPNVYTQEDLRTLQALADYCGGALERIHAEAARKQTEEVNRTILATAMDGFYALDFTTDPGGGITEANNAYCRLTGYSREEMLQMRITDLEVEETTEEVARHAATILAAGAERFETRHRRKDGREVQVEISVSRLAGSRQRTFSFVRDITERKQAEATREVFLSLGTALSAARSPLELARAIYANADSLWKWDSASLDLYLPESDRIEPVLNCDVVAGQRREVLPVHPGGPPSDRMRRILHKGAELILEEQPTPRAEFVTFGDTSRLSASMMYVPVRREGQAVGVLSIQSYRPNAYTQEDLRILQALADLCGGALERVQAEAALRKAHDELERRVRERTAELQAANTALRKSEGRLRLALDTQQAQLAYIETIYQNAPVGLCVLDANFRYIRINERLAAMNGMSVEQHIGRPVREAVPHLADGTEAICRQVIATGQPVLNLELEGMTDAQPGVVRTWIAHWVPLKAPDGRVTSISVLVEEITERKRAEEALRLRENEVRTLVENSHDFIVRLDRAAHQVYANAATARLYGLPPQDFLGKNLREMGFPEEVWRPAEETCNQVLTTGREAVLEQAHPFGGSMRYFEARHVPEFAPDGSVASVLVVTREITERKRAEEALRQAHDQLEQRVRERTAELQTANAALRESEERYRSLVNNLNVGVYRNTPGPHGRFLQVNPALARMHGYGSVEEFQQVKVADLYQEPHERKEFVAELLRQGAVLNYELRLKKKDGTPIYGSINATVHRGPDGEVDWIDGMIEDITRRKKAEQSLADALELNRTLVSASMVGIGAYKASGQCVVANPALAQIIGGTVEQVLQQDFHRLKSWRPSGLLAKARAALETGQPQELEARGQTTLGLELTINARFSSFMSQGERHLLLMATDETEAAHAREALRASEERYRALAESSPDAIFILDQNSKLQYVNATMAALWRRAPEELIGRRQQEIFPPDAAKQHERDLKGVFETGEPMHRDEPFTFPSGHLWVELRLVPLYGEQRKVASVMGICRDITERKRAEQRLAEALDLNQKMLAASAMGIAAYKASGECVFANEALARIVGGSLREVLQGNFRRLKSWEKSGRLQLAEEVLKQGRVHSGEVFATTRFGKTIWLDCHLAPFVSNSQPHLLMMALDITERKRAESLLQAQRDLGVSLSLTSDLDAALKRLLEISMQIGGVDSGGMYVLNEGSGGMDLVVHRGVSPAFVKAVSHYAPNSPQMRLVQRGKPFFGTHRTLPIPHEKPRLSEGLRAVAFLPLLHDRRVIGALVLSSHQADEIPRQTQLAIEAIAAQAAGAIARIRSETIRHRLERQILEISDREQARIGQDIHDGLCQELVSLAFDANSLHRELAGKHRPETKTARRMAHYLDQAITECRQLSRGLFPVRLETEGLPSALEELAKATRDRFKIRCRFTNKGPVAVENSTVATHLYRIAQEATANAVKHSRARSVAIRLRAHADKLELSVEDDGAGLSAARRKKATGLGLHIMDYRARTIGGTLRLARGRRGGTLVSCCVPRRRS